MRCLIIPGVRGSKNIPKFKPEGAYRPIYDLRGMKFGNWAVIKLVSPKSPVKWLCKCSCGREKVFDASEITRTERRGRDNCGCVSFTKLQKKLKTEDARICRPFSGYGSRLYHKWASMKQRCYNKKEKCYKWYGAKGIGVCDSWHDYKHFEEWALATGYDVGLELDRIDSNADYSPENCRWVTHGDNVRNIFKKGNSIC